MAITILEDRGDCAYIVENGVARIIPKEDEFQAKLKEFNNQNNGMQKEEEVVAPVEEVEEAPVAPETEPVNEFEEEPTVEPGEEENSIVSEDSAPTSEEDVRVEEAPVE